MIASPAALFEAPDADFAPLDQALRAIKATAFRKQAPSFDAARVAAAYREKRRPLTMRVPTERALSAAPCPNCGTRGSVGCSHFLPYQKEV